jgi:hypothetical protein
MSIYKWNEYQQAPKLKVGKRELLCRESSRSVGNFLPKFATGGKSKEVCFMAASKCYVKGFIRIKAC